MRLYGKNRAPITTEYIKLDKLLKFSGIAENGADAKDMILDEMVSYNGEICTMRGKKVRPGDTVVIVFEDETVQIMVNDMYIQQLTLQNFRNYETASVSFLNGTNIIYGNNAQGKTNILEAIFLFCTGRSHRRASDKEMIRQEQTRSVIDLAFCDDVRDYVGQMKLLEGKKKFVSINKVPVKKN